MFNQSVPLGGASLHNFNAFTPTVANLRPTSEIYITSKDSRDDPKIKMNYLSTAEDRQCRPQVFD